MDTKPKTYTAALGIRGDMLYCPLPLFVDSYWTCEVNCVHCFARRLNRTWGNDFRAADPEAVKRKLLSNRGSSPLSMAIQQRKTIRIGSRSDPFQPCEEEYGISTNIIQFLMEHQWDTVIQTKFPFRAWNMTGLGKYCTVMAIITVGWESDWERFEHKLTENPLNRIITLEKIQKAGYRVGANGEPFIPGYHTVYQFEDTMKLLKAHGIKSYNIYNTHLNDMVIKNFHAIGLDIERIWYQNQDRPWRKILRQLLEIAKKYDIILGCPDFVNSGWSNVQRSNTCCGLNVKNPCTFNTHHFKLAVQAGDNPVDCWDGVGDFAEGLRVITGRPYDPDVYTLNDIVGSKPK